MEEEQKSAYSYKRPLWQWLVIYAVIAILVYGVVYYFVLSKNKGYSPSQYQAPAASSSPKSETPTQKFTVEGSEFAFAPSTLTVKKGETVEIIFKNVGKFPHNLAISDLNMTTKNIQAGEETSITFTPDKTGQFEFTCTVPGHADKGMKGTLTVQ